MSGRQDDSPPSPRDVKIIALEAELEEYRQRDLKTNQIINDLTRKSRDLETEVCFVHFISCSVVCLGWWVWETFDDLVTRQLINWTRLYLIFSTKCKDSVQCNLHTCTITLIPNHRLQFVQLAKITSRWL